MDILGAMVLPSTASLWRWISKLQNVLVQAATVKYHRLGPLNSRNAFSHSSGGWESEISLNANMVGSAENSFLPYKWKGWNMALSLPLSSPLPLPLLLLPLLLLLLLRPLLLSDEDPTLVFSFNLNLLHVLSHWG